MGITSYPELARVSRPDPDKECRHIHEILLSVLAILVHALPYTEGAALYYIFKIRYIDKLTLPARSRKKPMAAGKPGLKTAPGKVEHAEEALHRPGETADSQWGTQPSSRDTKDLTGSVDVVIGSQTHSNSLSTVINPDIKGEKESFLPCISQSNSGYYLCSNFRRLLCRTHAL